MVGGSRSITNQYEAFNHTAALGTPIYMAPEILEHKSYSVKVDVYSFGIMLWVMYTRREPYTEFKRQWGPYMAISPSQDTPFTNSFFFFNFAFAFD